MKHELMKRTVVCMLVCVSAQFLIAVGETRGSKKGQRTNAEQRTNTGQRRVAVTIDDLPVVSRRQELAHLRRITDNLIRQLKADNIPAIGFVNENKLFVDGKLDSGRVELLESWLAAGLELGNHSYSHPDLHNTPLEEFKNDVLRGEIVTRRLVKSRGGELRFFRHPFLHTGLSLQTKQELEKFLTSSGYRVAPVTIDNSEWIFARAYDNAAEKGGRDVMDRIAADYVAYMNDKFEYFEKQSIALLGYEMKHTLLLHANALNGDHLGKLTAMIKSRGYRFISLDEALTDKAYELPDTYAGRAGITWIHRWAMTKGLGNEFFRGEPVTPRYILKLAGVSSE
jgi:peptidoglycan/xylan/chitin deacetylase (PgdA/CDA1 family)